MAIFINDFEEEVYVPPWTSTDVSVGATLAIQGSNVHHGIHSSFADSGATPSGLHAYCRKEITPTVDCYTRFYVYVTISDDGYFQYFVKLDGNSGLNVRLGCLGDGTSTPRLYMTYIHDGNYVTITSTTTISLNTYTCILIRFKSSATVGEVHVWKEGTEISDLAVTNIIRDNPNIAVKFGVVEDIYTARQANYIDCVVVDTSYIGQEGGAGPTLKGGSIASRVLVLEDLL
jgi:hypothetical protein